MTDPFVRKIEKIKKEYRFNIKKITSLPVETYADDGEPIAIEFAEDGFYILFQQWPSCFGKLVMYGYDFRERRTVIEGPNMVDFCYLPQQKQLWIARVSLLDLYKKNVDAAFGSHLNCVICCDQGGNVEEVLNASAEEPIFPLRLSKRKNGDVMVYNMNSGQLITINGSGHVIETIAAGVKFLRKLKTADSGEVYFNAAPQIGKTVFNNDEKFETLYRVIPPGQPAPIYQNKSEVLSPISDFEVGTDWLLTAQDRYLVKLTIDGDEIFRASLKDPRWENVQNTQFRIVLLTQDQQGENLLYCVSEEPVAKIFSVYRIEI